MQATGDTRKQAERTLKAKRADRSLVDGTRYESFANVTADEPGSYTLACDTSVEVITTPLSEFGSFLGPFRWWSAGGGVSA